MDVDGRDGSYIDAKGVELVASSGFLVGIGLLVRVGGGDRSRFDFIEIVDNAVGFLLETSSY